MSLPPIEKITAAIIAVLLLGLLLFAHCQSRSATAKSSGLVARCYSGEKEVVNIAIKDFNKEGTLWVFLTADGVLSTDATCTVSR